MTKPGDRHLLGGLEGRKRNGMVGHLPRSHKSDIRNGKKNKPVGEHFSLPGHSVMDLKVAFLQKNFRT